jgi:ethanolamine-phosphate cytidylyltransferase
MTKIKQYFMDGCFDGYHYGHAHAILQGKSLCEYLVLGTHTNEEMIQHKNDPLFDYLERIFMLQNCKYIDKFVGNVNYIVSCETLDKFNCSKYLHGNEILITKNGENGIDTNIINDRYITYETTEGISTTSLLLRLYNYKIGKPINYNNDIEYLKNIYNKTTQFNLNNYDHSKKIIYLDHSWDLLNSIHIKHIQKIKDKFHDYNLIGIINNQYDIYIYNQLERAIILSSIKLIDNVIMDYEYIQDNNLYINLNNSIDFNKKKYIMNINFEKFKKNKNVITQQ